jgi:hypothetical protein
VQRKKKEEHRMPRWMHYWPLLALTLLLALAGCGGAEPAADVAEEAATPATTAPAQEPTEEPTPTAPAQEPTQEPAPTAPTQEPGPAPEELPTDEDDFSDVMGGGAVGGETVTNELGYAFTVPDDWQVLVNSSFEGSGIVVMIPADASLQAPPEEHVIAVNVGEAASVLEGSELPEDPTVDEVIEVFTANVEADNTSVSEAETVQIGGVEGLAVDISGSLPNSEADGQGRLAVAMLDDGRVVAILGAAPPEEWDPAALDTIFETMDFEAAPADPISATDDITDTQESDTSGSAGEMDAAGQVTENTFPLPDDASNVQVLGSGASGSVNYETALSTEEVADFYRDALTSEGAVEREVLTQMTDGILNLVFDGWDAAPEGQVVVIQTVPLEPERMNVNVRFEDI